MLKDLSELSDIGAPGVLPLSSLRYGVTTLRHPYIVP